MKNWFFVIFFLVGITLSGCTSSNNGMDGAKPPEAVIEIGNKSYDTTLGTYCWKGNSQGVCVDTAGPVEILKGKEPITVNPGEIINFVINDEPKIILLRHLCKKECIIIPMGYGGWMIR